MSRIEGTARRSTRGDAGRQGRSGPTAARGAPATAASVGQKIKETRLQRGMTQEQLAGDEYTKAFVSAVEREESGISDQALEVFARRLEVPVDYFRISQRSFDMTISEVERLLHDSRADEALRHLSDLGARGALPRALEPYLQRWLGQAYLEAGRDEEALSHLLQALPEFEVSEDRVELETTRLLIGVAHYRQGNIGEAIQAHQLCLQAVKSGAIADPAFALRVYSSLGNEHVTLGNYDLALAHYGDAVRLAEAAQDARRLAASHWGISVAYKERGDLEAALRHARQALAMYEMVGNRRLAGQIENNIGIVHAQMGNWERARLCYEQTVTVAETTGDTTARAQALLNLVEYYTAIGDTGEAVSRLPEALQSAAQTGQPFYQVNGLLRASATHLAAGHLDDALEYARQARDLTKRHNLRIRHADACFQLASVLVARGLHGEAIPYYTEAFTTARGTAHPVVALV